MDKTYFRGVGDNNMLLQTVENLPKRHELESLIMYKDLSDNTLTNCFDQLKN